MKIIVTGGAGFIGSHLVDKLVADEQEVVVVDNLQSGFRDQVNDKAVLYEADITNPVALEGLFESFKPELIFHLAAIARTPWCMEDPLLAGSVNSQGTLTVLECARQASVSRTVLASSNVVYAAMTPYRASKEMVEKWAHVYFATYHQSVICLRFSNVYGPRQSELGPSPNVFAALRKCRREKGYVEITGDGEQSRDFTHVSDIVDGLIAAAHSSYCGVLDLCTGKNWTLNQVAQLFAAPVVYMPEREGDVKHIRQNPDEAKERLGWEAQVELPDGIKDCL
jgi:UDP-glucose 4-epimerase